MWEKNLIVGAIVIVLVAIGVVVYFGIQPGNKLYENSLYGFKLEYPGTWHEKGGEENKIVSFVGDKNIYKDFAPNTDIYTYTSNKTVDEFLAELKGSKEELSRNQVTLAGLKAMQMTVLNNLDNKTYKQEYVAVQKFDRYYVILSTDLQNNFDKHASNFDVIKNNFAFTNIVPEQFGGIGTLASDLKQKYSAHVPVNATFDWTEGNNTYLCTAVFALTETVVFIAPPSGSEIFTATFPNFNFDFITTNPMSADIEVTKGRTLNCISDAKKQCTELISTLNQGYTVEKRIYLINKETGLIEKVSVSSTAGSFSVVIKYD